MTIVIRGWGLPEFAGALKVTLQAEKFYGVAVAALSLGSH